MKPPNLGHPIPNLGHPIPNLGHPILNLGHLVLWWVRTALRDLRFRRASSLLEAHGLADVLKGLDGAAACAGGAIPQDGVAVAGDGFEEASALLDRGDY